MIRIIDMTDAIGSPWFAMFDTVTDRFLEDSYGDQTWDSLEMVKEGFEATDSSLIKRVTPLVESWGRRNAHCTRGDEPMNAVIVTKERFKVWYATHRKLVESHMITVCEPPLTKFHWKASGDVAATICHEWLRDGEPVNDDGAWEYTLYEEKTND